MPFMRYKTGGKLVRRPGCRHCDAIDAYRAARVAWELRRESSEVVPSSVPGVAGSDIACYQLDDETYKAAYPAPRFKDFLVQMADRGDAGKQECLYEDQEEDPSDPEIDYSSF